MMNRAVRAALVCGLLSAGPALSSSFASEVVREFHYDASRFSLVEAGEYTQVRVSRAAGDVTPGAPELPVLSEAVEIPGAARVTGVEVLSIETAPLASGVKLPPALGAAPGLPVERTTPDAAYYGRAGFQPGTPVTLGSQGWMRGTNLAFLKVVPVRWDARTGALERVTRVRVRLTLAGERSPALERLRLAPSWDRDPVASLLGRPAVPPLDARRAGAVTTEAGGGAAAETDEVGFEATQLPSVLGSPVSYVIITNEEMAPEFQRLANWKTQTGVPTVVRTMSFIHAQYPAATDDADRVRQFIRDAYQRWGTTWVLLGGDTQVVPTRFVWSSFFGGENIPCDMYYSCLDGDWNADGDGIYGEAPYDTTDLVPEVWVGRAPTTTLAEADHFVDKTLGYIQNPPGNYEHTVLFFAEVLFPQPYISGTPDLDGAEIAEQCLPHLQFNPAIHYARLYQRPADPRWEPGALQETRAVVRDSLNAGYNVATHIGHGYRNVMSCGDENLTNEDALGLTNGNKLINLYASNCTSNAIDFPSIGEAFMHAPNGGAVTNIGSSRFDFPAVGREYEEEYFRLLYVDSTTAVGEAQGLQKIPFLVSGEYDGLHRWTQTTLLLLGDPELRIYTGTPRVLAASHPGSLSTNTTDFPVTVTVNGSPLYGARVVAYKAGDEYAMGTTNGAGQVILPFRADSAGSCVITVTAFDAKPYQVTIPVTTGIAPALAERPFTVDDSGVTGNNDGKPDAGETVFVTIPVRNNGTTNAGLVNATLESGHPSVTVLSGELAYGTIAVGSTVAPGSFQLANAASLSDQTEVPLTLTLTDSASRVWVEKVAYTVAAPWLRHDRHTLVDVGGNNDGIADPGETCNVQISLHNLGSGTANAVTAVLRNHDGFATVTDSTSSWGALATGAETQGDAFTFQLLDANARLELRVSDSHGLRWSKVVDLVPPDAPGAAGGMGTPSSIALRWPQSLAEDLLGYNVYRASMVAGPYVRLNSVPTGRTAYYLDDGLPTLTQFHYKVSAVDSSGNESSLSAIGSASTNPPSHTYFPAQMNEGTIASVAVDHLYPGYPLDIVGASKFVYVWHHDGTAPVDADGQGATSGDFSIRGGGYDSAPAIADIDDDGVKDIVAISSDSTRVYAYDLEGVAKPGWPVVIGSAVWSSPAIGDLDGDGQMEIVFSSNANRLYVLRSNGAEWADGDMNPGTFGVFKTLSNHFNYGTPGLADLDGGGLDIVCADFNGVVHAFHADGSYVPGFPVDLPGLVTASVAIGHLDGPSDTELDIVVATGDLFNTAGGDSVYVLRANGARRPGFPQRVKLGGNNKAPSPALADMNGDTKLDVVVASTNGKLYVYDGNGVVLPSFNGVVYSGAVLSASESSPIVADINGDGLNDVLIGDETGRIAAIGGNGAMMAGFPIFTDAEIKGAPAACDCDGDGKTEIVVAGNDRNVYMWDYDFPFSPNGPPPWPQYNHDARRTNLASNPVFVAAEDPPAPRTLSFAAPRPNPTNRGAVLAWAVPAEQVGQAYEVAVFDLAGRMVRVVERGAATAGHHRAAWDLRDAGGARVANGMYFARLTLGKEQRTHKLAVMR
jgi:hypothetical protein